MPSLFQNPNWLKTGDVNVVFVELDLYVTNLCPNQYQCLNILLRIMLYYLYLVPFISTSSMASCKTGNKDANDMYKNIPERAPKK